MKPGAARFLEGIMRVLPCIVLIAAAMAFGDEFPPPSYRPAAGDALDGLLKAKLAWLKKKIDAEEKEAESLRKKIKDPEYDAESHKKALEEVEKPLKADKQEEADLSEKDAIDPSKNSDAGKHAKLIRKNVQAWIERLEAMKQSELTASVNEKDKKDREKAAKDAKEHGDSADALQKDLDKAEKASPKLFQ